MPGGTTTGQFEHLSESRAGKPDQVAAGSIFVWKAEFTLPNGTWLLDIAAVFELRNLTMRIAVSVGTNFFPVVGDITNSTAPNAMRTMRTLAPAVKVTGGKPVEIRVTLVGGANGGELGQQSVTILAWKLSKITATTPRTKPAPAVSNGAIKRSVKGAAKKKAAKKRVAKSALPKKQAATKAAPSKRSSTTASRQPRQQRS